MLIVNGLGMCFSNLQITNCHLPQTLKEIIVIEALAPTTVQAAGRAVVNIALAWSAVCSLQAGPVTLKMHMGAEDRMICKHMSESIGNVCMLQCHSARPRCAHFDQIASLTTVKNICPTPNDIPAL